MARVRGQLLLVFVARAALVGLKLLAIELVESTLGAAQTALAGRLRLQRATLAGRRRRERLD